MTSEAIDRKELRVMLVDDDTISTFIYRKVIEKGGISEKGISTFLKGEDALEFLLSNLDNPEEFPDLILLDINMPIMDGWGFLAEYSEKIWPKLSKRVVLCMLSSSVYKQDVDKAFSYSQVSDYVPKPLTSDSLAQLLKKHFSE